MGPGARTAYQHDAREQPDGNITFFDNGATPKAHPQSRAIEVRLDTQAMTATLVREQSSIRAAARRRQPGQRPGAGQRRLDGRLGRGALPLRIRAERAGALRRAPAGARMSPTAAIAWPGAGIRASRRRLRSCAPRRAPARPSTRAGTARPKSPPGGCSPGSSPAALDAGRCRGARRASRRRSRCLRAGAGQLRRGAGARTPPARSSELRPRSAAEAVVTRVSPGPAPPGPPGSSASFARARFAEPSKTFSARRSCAAAALFAAARAAAK